MLIKKHNIILTISFFIFCTGKEKAFAQLTISNALTPAQLVQNVLLGPGVIATNITFSGNALQRGTFDATNAILGLDSGVILSSGDINVAVGPNDLGSATLPAGGFNGPADPDLTIIAGQTTLDAAVLEFDFIPIGDTIRFSYVFASEEYPEFVGSAFNDAFGFFISGPGIFGPYTNNAVNIALIPSTITAVTINNVNNGTANAGPCMNCAYYINNGTGSTPPCNTDPQCIQFDGRTVVLEAVFPVQCSQTYHIKLAIADAFDAFYDSGVFLKSGSFSSAGVQVSVTTVTGDSTIIEGCTDATFTFTRSDTTSDLTVYFSIAGNAINGLDFDSIADSIIINQGSFSGDLVIFPIFDSIIEGIDTIIVTVFNITACGDTIPEIAIIYIAEDYVLTVTANDVTTCPGNTIALTAAASGGILPYTFSWSDGQSGNTIFVTKLVTDTLIVTVMDSCGLKIAADTVIVNIQPLSDTSTVSNVSCNGGNDGSATVFPAGGKTPFTFSWSSGGSGSTETGLTAGTFFVTIIDSNGCSISDSVLITQPDSLALATTRVDAVCNTANGTATVSVSGGTTPYTYLWNDPLTQTDTIADSLSPGVYWVIVTDSLSCVDSVSVIINAPPGFSGTISDSINISCFGANDGSATVTVTGGTPPFIYQWFNSAGDTLAGQTDSMAINLPPGTYTVAIEGTDSLSCMAFQIVTLTGPTELKDSLKSIQNEICTGACNGIAIVTPTGGSPPYVYQWNDPFSQTDSTADSLCNGNYSVTITDANLCVDSVSVSVNSISGPKIRKDNKDVSCNGYSDGEASVTITVGSPFFTTIWSTGDTIILFSLFLDTAIITNLPADTFYVFVTDSNGCTANDTVIITEPLALVDIISSTNITCFGLSDGTATANPSGGTPTYSYEWNDPVGQTTQTATGLQADTFYVTITDTNNCTTNDSIIITEPPLLSFTTDSIDEICINTSGEAIVSVLGGVSPYQYSWFDDQGDTIGQTTDTASGLSQGTYSVIITDGNLCIDTVFVTVKRIQSLLSLTIIPIDATCDSANGSAIAVVNGGNRDYVYFWTPSGGTDSIANNLSGFPDSLIYSVTVIDINGCETNGSVVIANIDTPGLCGPYILTIYNGFSPNDDKINDIWFIDGIHNFPENRVLIYNRWGDLVWEGKNYDNKNVFWDGANKNGRRLPDGTYYYVLEITNNTPRKIIILNRSCPDADRCLYKRKQLAIQGWVQVLR